MKVPISPSSSALPAISAVKTPSLAAQKNFGHFLPGILNVPTGVYIILYIMWRSGAIGGKTLTRPLPEGEAMIFGNLVVEKWVVKGTNGDRCFL